MPIIDLTNVDNQLGSLSGNFTPAQKTLAINRVNTEIPNYCQRILDATNYAAWYNGTGTAELVLEEYPLISVSRMCSSRRFSFQLSNSVNRNNVSILPDGTMRLSVVGVGSNTLILSAYGTLALLGAAITALGAGWTWTVQSEDDPTHLRPLSEGATVNGLIELESPDEPKEAIIQNPGASIIADLWGGFPRGIANIFVSYRAGYEAAAMPADLVGIGTSYAVDILNIFKKDSNLKSEKLGDYAYTKADVDSGSSLLATNYGEALSYYKRRIL